MIGRTIRPRSAIGAAVALLVAAVCLAPRQPARAASQDLGTDAQRESGRQLYETYCSQCHGEQGDGKGPAAPFLSPKPRDFTTGRFKVRSTPSGALPTHNDLVEIIRRGMPYTTMPGWPTLSNQQLNDLAYYIKSFSPDFANPELTPQPVPLPSAPRMSEESVEAGRQLYGEIGCVQCHGTLGRGDGPSAPTLKDEAGNPLRPADLTQSWTFRGGSSREDIFRTMTTGFNGTPMPAFLDALTEEQRWAITDFIASLSGDGPHYTNLVVARPLDEPIDLERGAELFESAPVARFPLVGQIMEPGRAFHPLTSSVTVQAVYDAESVALLVRWHDMSAQTTGTNDPALPVPIEEEQPAPEPAAGDSIWGGAEVTEQPPADPFADPFADPVGAVPESEFSDAVAVQLPMQPTTGARKPYFIFGDSQSAVDLWFYDLAKPEPLQFTGRGSTDIAPNDTGDVTGRASYDQGEWSVIFRRPLRATSGAPFTPGQFVPIAFSVWDGLSRERGNKRALTAWQSLYLQPQEVPSAVGPMIRTAAIILLIELVIIAWVRRRYGAGRAAVGGETTQQAATGA